MIDLLKLLEKNSRYTSAQLAAMLGMERAEVEREIESLESRGIIRGYTAIVDWEQTGREYVGARIELKVAPKRDKGFEEVAEQISRYEEVQSVYLMSGGYDLAVTIIGRTFQEIAAFVAYRLATLDSVQSTSTHFILRRYKERGVLVCPPGQDERRVVL